MKFLVFASILFLTGCAMPTTSVPRAEAVQVPKEQILALDLLVPDQTRTEKIMIVRDSGFMGSFLELYIIINKKRIVSLKPKERFEFYLAPGRYMFSVDAKNKVFNENPGESDVEILKNGLNNFRLRLIPGDEPRVERSQQLE